MEAIKDYRGKIIQVDLQYHDEEVKKHIGIVLKQHYELKTGIIDITILEANGCICTFGGSLSDLSALKSVRLSPDERIAFQNAYKSYVKLQNFLEKYDAEKTMLEADFRERKNELKEFSDYLSFEEFSKLLSELFHQYFSETHNVSFHCRNCSREQATISLEKDCGKWLDFDAMEFIYQEYDGEYFVIDDIPEHDEYCAKHGPHSISALDQLYEKSYHVAVGDKRTMSIFLDYMIPLKHGLTRSSLKAIEAELEQVLKKDNSIDSKINSAVKRNRKEEKQTTDKKPNPIR